MAGGWRRFRREVSRRAPPDACLWMAGCCGWLAAVHAGGLPLSPQAIMPSLCLPPAPLQLEIEDFALVEDFCD